MLKYIDFLIKLLPSGNPIIYYDRDVTYFEIINCNQPAINY